MTLPSSRRPPEVEDLLQEDHKSESLTLRINLNKCFMDEMNAWFEFSLHEKQRRELTKKRIIRRAMAVSFKVGLEFEKLPRDWLKTFCERYDIDLRISSRRKFHNSQSVSMLFYNEQRSNSFDNGSVLVDPENNNFDEILSENVFNGNIIDLTKEPPPKEWLGPYLRGEGWSRRLCSHKNPEGVTIIYYDYSLPNVDEDINSEVKILRFPHDLDNVFPSI